MQHAHDLVADRSRNGADRLYSRQFFRVFAGVGLFMTGVALQFHFGQYVAYLGYGVDTLGVILGLGMLGALLMRLHMGRWIDRFGCRPVWLAGTLTAAAAVGTIQFADRLWLVVLLRTVSTVAIGAVLTTAPVFAASIAPPGRRTEAIGTIGLAGFVGMIVGPTLGDWIFASAAESITPYRIFFSASAACSLAACAVMARMTVGTGMTSMTPDVMYSPSAERGSLTAQIRVIRDHWPGAVLIVGVVFSMVFCLQTCFLERLAEQRGFKDIKMFFLVYGPTAMTLRLIFRRVPQRIGRTRTVLGGLVLLACGLSCLIGIKTPLELVLPGLLMGAGHCFVFPSMIDLAAERLPGRYRGTGTTLILGAGDLGMLIGFVSLGEVIDAHGFDSALTLLVVVIVAGAIVFAVARRDALLGRLPRTGSDRAPG